VLGEESQQNPPHGGREELTKSAACWKEGEANANRRMVGEGANKIRRMVGERRLTQSAGFWGNRGKDYRNLVDFRRSRGRELPQFAGCVERSYRNPLGFGKAGGRKITKSAGLGGGTTAIRWILGKEIYHNLLDLGEGANTIWWIWKRSYYNLPHVGRGRLPQSDRFWGKKANKIRRMAGEGTNTIHCILG